MAGEAGGGGRRSPTGKARRRGRSGRTVALAFVGGVSAAGICFAVYDRLWEGGRDSQVAQPAGDEAPQRPAAGTARDWEIAREHFIWATTQPPAAFPRFGDLLARLGERFVGTPYQPQTLELAGPERLVINLEALDCVTFVENVLVLARLAWAGAVDDPDDFRSAYRDELTRIRYRGGVLDGYASRLHYFSEWITDNESLGMMDAIARDLGGVADPSPIDFMSTHPDAYRQLADPAVLTEIARMEARLAEARRYYIPAGAIDAASGGIRDGDIIAATSTVAGLDVAHAGIALWRDGTLRLMHAPLVGSHVQISEESLAERIARIGGQDGIMVARPLAPGD